MIKFSVWDLIVLFNWMCFFFSGYFFFLFFFLFIVFNSQLYLLKGQFHYPEKITHEYLTFWVYVLRNCEAIMNSVQCIYWKRGILGFVKKLQTSSKMCNLKETTNSCYLFNNLLNLSARRLTFEMASLSIY